MVACLLETNRVPYWTCCQQPKPCKNQSNGDLLPSLVLHEKSRTMRTTEKEKDAPVLRLASTQWFSQNNRGTKSVSDAVLVWKFRLPQRANFDALRLPCLAPKMQVNERVLLAWNAWVVCLDELCVWCLSRQVCAWELFCASRCVHKRVSEKVPEKKIWKKNPEKVWEDFVQNQVRARGFRRRFGKRFGHALVQSQVRFNTVLENVLTFKPSKPAKPARPAKTSKLY